VIPYFQFITEEEEIMLRDRKQFATIAAITIIIDINGEGRHQVETSDASRLNELQ